MCVNVFEPVSVPSAAWRREQTRAVLRARDVAGLLKFVQQYTGASQNRLAIATGMAQGRISEIIRGGRLVTALDVFERIADGLAMPDDARILLGLAPTNPAGLDHLGPSGRAEVIAAYPGQSAAQADMRAAAKDAHEIDILAVRGLGILGLNDSLLRASVTAKRPAVLVLLLDPDSDAAIRRAVEIGESVESFTSGLRLAIARLRELVDRTDGAVQGYLYDLLPTWRVIRLDNTMFVSAFGSDHEGHTSPMYRISETRSGALYRGYRRFVEELRISAKHVL